VEGITLYSILYYEKSVFKGSYKGMNFYLQKGGDEDNKMLVATAWKGPFAFDKTKEEKHTENFPFTEEGIRQADEWFSRQQQLLCTGDL
jgi:hypothetical protein